MSTWSTLVRGVETLPTRTIVALAGLPASGKSTCLSHIRVQYPNFSYLSEQITFFENSELRLINSLKKGDFYQKGSVAQKILQEIYMKSEMRRQAYIESFTKPGSIVFLDRGVEDTVFATEMLGRMDIIDLSTFRQEYYGNLLSLRSSLVVLLNASQDTILHRLYSRQETTGVVENRDDYYSLFSNEYLSWFVQNVPNISVIETERASVFEVVEMVTKEIETFVQLRS